MLHDLAIARRTGGFDFGDATAGPYEIQGHRLAHPVVRQAFIFIRHLLATEQELLLVYGHTHFREDLFLHASDAFSGFHIQREVVGRVVFARFHPDLHCFLKEERPRLNPPLIELDKGRMEQ